jgi:choline dehydrogenase
VLVSQYIHPIMDGEHPNLHLTLDTWVDRLVSKGNHVVVECMPKNSPHCTVHARHEVLLCAGAIDSPCLLLPSGVRPCKQLLDFGIPVKHDLPGISESLQLTIHK